MTIDSINPYFWQSYGLFENVNAMFSVLQMT